MDKNRNKQDSKIFQTECPCCHSILWIDSTNKEVMKFEKKRGKKGNLDELLEKERKRKAGFETRFDSTAELAEEKKKDAQKRYQQAFIRLKKQDDKD
ncbi:MAG: hypothetical protein GF421_04190 [Candidatus Aminicenantes bacterium]|nr:hypothetical protein [Candidatus Aminicenantes bacterium]